MATKKPSIAPMNIANRKPVKSLEDFVNGAASSNVEERIPDAAEPSAPVSETTVKKKQIPLMILPSLLMEMDEKRAAKGTGLSRAAWICEAIREKIDREGR